MSENTETYRLPGQDLLNKPEPGCQLNHEKDQSASLEEILTDFGAPGKVVNVVHGPSVTRYEVLPARGVTVKKFTNLRDDLAQRLAVKSVRVEAPVLGCSTFGIEVPNINRELVLLHDVLASDAFRFGKGLCFGLGKDTAGQIRAADLDRMPHLLIAGTTGSGKTVCIDTIILSLIYRFTPSSLQMLMIDPKQAELSIYEGIPHLIGLADDDAKIICDAKKAAVALNQMVGLMEARCALFAKYKVRNLKEFNSKADTKLPWVVVIIDELADLIMVAQKPVETAICRLAQKAHAAGILMIVATQRPSADVLTGLIRSNIPSRISFAVPSQVESRIILDAMGAEDLLGKGDMLFKPLDAPAGIRIQGAYVTNDEIERVAAFWEEQPIPENHITINTEDAEDTNDAAADGSPDTNPQSAFSSSEQNSIIINADTINVQDIRAVLAECTQKRITINADTINVREIRSDLADNSFHAKYAKLSPSAKRMVDNLVNELLQQENAEGKQQVCPSRRSDGSIPEDACSGDADEEDYGSDSEHGTEFADDKLIRRVLADIDSGLIIRKHGLSPSSLQSLYRIGYSRARRIVNLMEDMGLLGSAYGSRPREILYNGAWQFDR